MDISAYQHMNIRMSTRGKRPLRNLTPNDKVRAIQRIHNGETKASVSRDLGVPESTLRGWCKNEQKLRFMCRQLGPDHLGIDTPPEKRAKYEMQLLPPKLATLPNYDDLGLSNFLFSATEFPTQNESILEKLSLVEFVKKNGLHPNAIRELGDAAPPNSLSGVDYSTNNMIHQLTFLAQLNSKLSYQMGEPMATDIQGSPSTGSVDTPGEENATKTNCPLLSVKNWAKDPAKRAHFSQATQLQLQLQLNNDKNNNAVDPSYSAGLTTTQYPLIMEPVKSAYPETTVSAIPPTFSTHSDLAPTPPTPTTDSDCQGAALLDWCKLFNASLNFLAFAAAAASMQPSDGTVPKHITTQHPTTTDADETYPFNNALAKRLSPLAHSDASNESYFDSEPEDLSVRSCASSRNNSRSQTPDKSIATGRLQSDEEQ